MKKNTVLTITGPSLTGKSTLASDLLENSSELEVVVTHTTRPPRQGEVNGVSYHFVTKEEFEKLIKTGQMIEFAEVGPAGNKQLYGTSVAGVKKAFENNKMPVLVIEPQGAAAVYAYTQKCSINAYQVFINNDRDTLIKRFLERFQADSLATVDNYAKRLKNMIDIEPSNWIAPALDGRHRYDKVFNQFDQNRTEVIQEILSALEIEKKNKMKI